MLLIICLVEYILWHFACSFLITSSYSKNSKCWDPYSCDKSKFPYDLGMIINLSLSSSGDNELKSSFWWLILTGFSIRYFIAPLLETSESFPRATMKMKLAPCPKFDRQTISPLNIFVSFFDMLSPKPMPFVLSLLLDSRKPNNWNNFFWSSSLMPMPVSFT